GIGVELAQIDATAEFNYPAAIIKMETNHCGDVEFAGLQLNQVYRLRAIAPDSYTVLQQGTRFVHLCSATTEHIDFTLRRCNNYQRLVLVNDCGEPWEGVTIGLCPEGHGESHLIEGKVDNGIAVFENATPGSYSLKAWTTDQQALVLSDA